MEWDSTSLGQFTVTTKSINPIAGQCLDFSVSYADPANSGAGALDDIPVTMASSTSGQFYNDSACLTPMTTLSILKGLSKVSAYFKSNPAGIKTLTAANASMSSGTLTFVILPAAISATGSSITGNPSTGVAPDGITPSIVNIYVKDLYGNPISGQAVTFNATGTGNTLTQPAAVSDSNGLAVGNIKSTIVEVKTLSIATPSSLLGVTPSTVTFIGASPSLSTISMAGSPALANGSTPITASVIIRDTAGNPMIGKSVTLSALPTGAVIGGSPAVTDASGAVSFAVTTTAAKTYTFTAIDATDAVTLTSTPTAVFVPTAVSPTVTTIVSSPPTVVADGTTTSTVTVTLKDASGNAVSSKNVTLSATPSTGVTIGGNPATTSVGGNAIFTVKSTKSAAVAFSAVDTTDSISITPTTTVTFTPGVVSPAISTVTSSPSTSIADGTSTSTITVTLKDANSNGVAGKSVTLTAAPATGVSITGSPSTTNASGVAAFTVSSTSVNTIFFSAIDVTDSISITPTASVIFSPGTVSPALSTVSASLSSVTADGTATSTITVTMMDALSHPVPSKSVTLTASPASGVTITGSPGTTNGSGSATFTVQSTTAAVVSLSAVDTTDSISITPHATVTFTPGPVVGSASAVAASPSSVPADGSTTSTITVTLKDANANPVSGKSVSLTSNRGATDTISSASGTSAANGTVTFTVTSLTAGSAVFTASDVTDTITVSPSNATVTFSSGLILSDATTFDFGTHGLGTTFEHSFVLSNPGVTATSITPASFSTGAYSFKQGSYPGFGGTCGTSLGAGAGCLIVVVFNPASAITYNDTLTLNYSNPSANSVSRPITGLGTSAAILAITDLAPNYYTDFHIPLDGASYSYGSIGIGRSVDHSFFVTNNGSNTATGLSTPAVSAPFIYKGGAFPGTGGDCTSSLSAGVTCQIVVSYSPTAAVFSSGTFSISYSDGLGGTPTASRPYNGTGVSTANLIVYDYYDGTNGLYSGSYYYYGQLGVSNTLDQTFFVFNTGGGAATALTSGSMASGYTYKGGSFPGGTPGGSVQNSKGVTYCAASLPVGSICAVTVTFSPVSPVTYSGNINVSYNNGATVNATRPVSGMGISTAKLVVSDLNGGGPDTLSDFGIMAVSATSQKYLVVTNVGAVSATGLSASGMISALNYSGGSYPGGSGSITYNGQSYNYCTTSLTANAQCILQLTFAPLSTSTYSSSVIINYSGGSASSVTYGVTGQGTNLAIVSMTTCSGNCNGGGGNGTPNFDFGTVKSSSVSDMYFFVSNDGNTSTTVSNGLSPTGPFSYPGGYPGGTPNSAVTVYGNGYNFCPSSGGSLSAHTKCVVLLRFTSSGSTSSSSSFRLDFTGATVANLPYNLLGTSSNLAIVSLVEEPNNTGYYGSNPFSYGTFGFAVSKVFFVKNDGNTSATLSSLSVSAPWTYTTGSYPGGTGSFTYTNSNTYNYCSGTLAASSVCAISVQFTPSGSNSYSGSISLNVGSATFPTVSRSITANSTPSSLLRISEHNGYFGCDDQRCYSYNFGSVARSSSSGRRDFIVTNVGSSAASAMSAGGTPSAPFTFDTAGGGSYPGGTGSVTIGGTSYPYCTTSLSSGSSCAVSVDLSPSAGAATGTVNQQIFLNYSGGSASRNITGNVL